MRTKFALFLVIMTCVTTSPPANAEPAKETTNSIGQKLVLIPAGEFLMGGCQSPAEVIERFPAYMLKPEDFADEYPQHKVKITKPFYMCRHETTVGQFKKFIADT